MWPHEWDACSWDLQRMYADGFEAEGLVSFGGKPEGLEDVGVTGRTVDTGGGVIDLAAMRAELSQSR
jgi:hypothetical protein